MTGSKAHVPSLLMTQAAGKSSAHKSISHAASPLFNDNKPSGHIASLDTNANLPTNVDS